MYLALFGIFSGAAFYLGYNYNQIKSELERPRKQLIRLPNHSFFPRTISDYTEMKEERNKFVIYSRLHQCPLSTHQLINKQSLEI